MAVHFSNRVHPRGVRIRGLEGTYVPPPPPNVLRWTTNPTLVGTYDERSSFSYDFGSVIFDPSGSANDWSITAGALPEGLSLNAFTGVVSGTLPEVDNDTLYAFTLQVNDLLGATLSGRWSIRVHNLVPAVQWVTPGGELNETSAGDSVYQPLEARSV